VSTQSHKAFTDIHAEIQLRTAFSEKMALAKASAIEIANIEIQTFKR